MVWRATTSAAPAPASTTVSRWARSGTTPAASAPSAPSTGPSRDSLCNGDVVTDADVGRERCHDRAVLLERQVDGLARLRLLGALAPDGEVERDRGIAARRRLATRPDHRHLERDELDALLLQDDDDIGGGARRGGKQQQLDRRCGGLRVAVHEDRGPARRSTLKLERFGPAHR